MCYTELTSRELISWEVDLVGVDLVGVDLVGVDLVEVDHMGGHLPLPPSPLLPTRIKLCSLLTTRNMIMTDS